MEGRLSSLRPYDMSLVSEPQSYPGIPTFQFLGPTSKSGSGSDVCRPHLGKPAPKQSTSQSSVVHSRKLVVVQSKRWVSLTECYIVDKELTLR